MRWIVLACLLAAGCKTKPRRMTSHDGMCRSGRAFLYLGSDDREARRKMTEDGCSDQIVETIHDDKESGLIGCCPD